MVEFYSERGRKTIAPLMHQALVGSPAYVNSEIAICNGDGEDDFYLVVGKDSENDLTVLMESITTFKK